MRILSMFFTWLFIFQGANAGGTATVTVGSDGACDYSSITAVSLNEPTSDLLDIRVAKNHAMAGLQILDDRETIIRGGYDTCVDTTASGRTVLDGNGTGPVFVVSESTNTLSYLDLFLVDLEITGGSSNTSGGVLSLTGGWLLGLDNVFMHNNFSNQNGGAIFIKPSIDVNVLPPQLFINGDSIISNNTADNGGAVACDGIGQITAFNMLMVDNEASQNGGAVYLTNGCTFEQFGGGLLQGIILNNAVMEGGGIYASNNVSVLIKGNLGYGAAVVSSNSAESGGGIFISQDSMLTVIDAVISNNSATKNGGGINAFESHVVIRREEPGARCHDEVRCSRISENSAGFSGGGAVVFGGTLEVKGTYIENNFANFGSAIRTINMPLLGGGSIIPITMVGNVFAANRNAQQVVYLDESSADIAFSTFVDNEDIIEAILMDYSTTSGVGNRVRIFGSVFEHPGSTIASAKLRTAGQLPVGDCNRNESGSTGDLIGQSRSSTNPVIFENQASGDYRLQDGSSYIDYCNGSFLDNLSNYSANGLPKPVDNSVDDLHGTYDLGGLERYDLDLIFANDFE